MASGARRFIEKLAAAIPTNLSSMPSPNPFPTIILSAKTLTDLTDMTTVLSHLSQKACKRLREAGLATRTLTLTIRYAGFDTHTRSKTLGESSSLDSVIHAAFQELFRLHRDRSRKVRLLGVSLSGFTHGGEQLDLLQAQQREKLQKLTQAADRLRDKFGFDKVQFGGSLRRDDSPPDDADN